VCAGRAVQYSARARWAFACRPAVRTRWRWRRTRRASRAAVCCGVGITSAQTRRSFTSHVHVVALHVACFCGPASAH
jgi:hypothetical protein